MDEVAIPVLDCIVDLVLDKLLEFGFYGRGSLDHFREFRSRDYGWDHTNQYYYQLRFSVISGILYVSLIKCYGMAIAFDVTSFSADLSDPKCFDILEEWFFGLGEYLR